MLVIRKEQMATLEADMLARFRVRLRGFLRHNLPAETAKIGDEELNRLIDLGSAQAAGYGITIERDVSLFVALVARYRPGFQDRPEMAGVKRILLKPSLAGAAKISLVYQVLSARENPPAPSSG